MRRPAVITFPLWLSCCSSPEAHGQGPTLDRTGPEGGPIRSILVDPMTANTIYAGTLGSGVFKSTDGGANWTQTHPNGPLALRTVRALVRDNAGTLYAGVEDPVNALSGGVFRSLDAGGTWTAMDTGLTNKKVQTLASTNTSLYAGTREETVTVGSTTTTFTGGVFKWDG